MTNDDSCYLTAHEALALFRKRKLSPVELLKALIDRSEKVNPRINCWSETYFDEALDAAAAIGLRLAAVDMFDVAGEFVVIEVNSNPMIATLEEAGRWDLIAEIWRANIAVALK